MKSFGHGIGLRTAHYAELLERGAPVPCVEAITENFLGRGGRPRALLDRVRRDAAIALHGVGLSIGGTDQLRLDYLEALRDLAHETDACVVSDHLCFGTFGGHHGHDLWPLPYTEEALEHVIERVDHVQAVLGRRIALENPSSYLVWNASVLSEAEFLAEVATRADCHILLDLNNVHVSAMNHGFSARGYLWTLPRDRVAQYHLAGHSVRDGYLFDDHGSHVGDDVWTLYREAVSLFGDQTAIVEWDENVPSLSRLVEEAWHAADVAALGVSARAQKVAS